MLDWLSEERGEAVAREMWSKIGDICTMTIISILPILRREYASVFEKKVAPQNDPGGNDDSPPEQSSSSSSQHDYVTSKSGVNGQCRCFEILGFDIMIDKDLDPSLIEVNHLPSWGTDSPIDEDIKSRVITQALSAIKVNAQDRKLYETAKRKQSHVRLRNQSTMASADDIVIDDQGQAKSDGCASRKRPPTLFDSNSAERKIRAVYEKYAPEKLDKVKDLLNRYRGYEEWLVKKVEDKYNGSDDDSSSSSSSEEEDDDWSYGYSTQRLSESERRNYEEEERILKDYDRIYPPPKDGRISSSRYREMERFVTEMDSKQQRRLTCPLQSMRPTNGNAADNEFNTHGRLNRGDSWIRGNVHVRSKKADAKITRPPTKKQTEFADRLSRGYSVEDTDVSEKCAKKKSRILHHDFIYEEENPFYHLIDRVKQSRELSKETRRRAEKKLRDRSSKSGAALKQQIVQLGIEDPFVEMREYDAKFYRKRRGFEEFT